MTWFPRLYGSPVTKLSGPTCICVCYLLGCSPCHTSEREREKQQDAQTPPGPQSSTEVKAAYPASLLVPCPLQQQLSANLGCYLLQVPCPLL